MLYIMSQNGKKLTDLKTVSIVDPGHSREDDEFYRVYVNSVEFAKYTDSRYPVWIMKEIQKFIHLNWNSCFRLPKDGEDVWTVRP